MLSKIDEILTTEKDLHPDSNLLSLKHVVLWLFEQIKEHDFEVWHRYDLQGCLCSSIDHDHKKIMWHIAATSGVTLLWDLIHEFGHMLIGKPNEKDRGKYGWERRAWDHGWNVVIEKFPELNIHRQSFEQRRDQRLSLPPK